MIIKEEMIGNFKRIKIKDLTKWGLSNNKLPSRYNRVKKTKFGSEVQQNTSSTIETELDIDQKDTSAKKVHKKKLKKEALVLKQKEPTEIMIWLRESGLEITIVTFTL